MQGLLGSLGLPVLGLLLCLMAFQLALHVLCLLLGRVALQQGLQVLGLLCLMALQLGLHVLGLLLGLVALQQGLQVLGWLLVALQRGMICLLLEAAKGEHLQWPWEAVKGEQLDRQC